MDITWRILSFMCFIFTGNVSAVHEHGESRSHRIHTATSRITRWHVHHKQSIPVHNMRVDCLGTQLSVLDLTMIQTGSVCHATISKPYLKDLGERIQNCSQDNSCFEVTWDNKKLNTTDCGAYFHDPRYFCGTYLIQYRKQCIQFFARELHHTNIVTALDIEVQCVDKADSDIDHSVLVIYDQAPINIGHLMTECESRQDDRYLQIVGFVEAAEKCPADRYSYSTPYTHPLTKTLQDYVAKRTPLVDFDAYQKNLSLRLICGNVVFPVVYDSLLPLSRAHGWIYYKCGILNKSEILWDGHWLNFSRVHYNGSHEVHSSVAIHSHCGWGHRLFVLVLLILLMLALACDVFTLYRRDDIVAYLRAKQKQKNQRTQVRAAQPELPRSHQHGVELQQLSPTAESLVSGTDSYLLSNNTSMTTLRNVESRELLPFDNPTSNRSAVKPYLEIVTPENIKKPEIFMTPHIDDVPTRQPAPKLTQPEGSFFADNVFAGGDIRNERRPLSAMASFLEADLSEPLPRLFEIRSRSMSKLHPPSLNEDDDIPCAQSAVPQITDLQLDDCRPKSGGGRTPIMHINPVRARPLVSSRKQPISRTISAGNVQVRSQSSLKERAGQEEALPAQRSTSGFVNPTYDV